MNMERLISFVAIEGKHVTLYTEDLWHSFLDLSTRLFSAIKLNKLSKGTYLY
jgi:hypothetical protein